MQKSLALAAAGLAVLLAAGCSSAPRHAYTAKGDVKPHPGVARAHSFAVHGIDVSRYQGDVDWQAVKSAGTKFAFIKATEGGDYIDEKFHHNWRNARSAGVPRGAYHFMYWCRPAREQAEWFRQNVPTDRDALPPVLDLEWNGHSKTCPRKLPRDEALAKINVMLAAMEEHTGKKPIIYTDITFHKEVLEGELPEHSFWLRSVAAEPHEKYDSRPWSMWQFTTTGRVPGIAGDVDRNVFAGSNEEWHAFLEANSKGQNREALVAVAR